ncbi:hypothetical protein [Terasakiella sp.]|uniref:hypothetical protein n=1 Tax=Terasakiella sp. TaxID=2034861 RepID=UPI003AA9451E
MSKKVTQMDYLSISLVKLFAKSKAPDVFFPSVQADAPSFSHQLVIPFNGRIFTIRELHDDYVVFFLRNGKTKIKYKVNYEKIAQIYVVTYYKRSRFGIHTLISAFLGKYLGVYWLFDFFNQFKSALHIREFNILKKRKQVLEAIIEIDLQMSQENVISPETVLSQLYGRYYDLAESNYDQMKEIKLLFDAFVETGELIECSAPHTFNKAYKSTGKALKTLESLSASDKRHNELASIQNKMKWLTVCLVIFTAIQAKIISIDSISTWLKKVIEWVFSMNF